MEGGLAEAVVQLWATTAHSMDIHAMRTCQLLRRGGDYLFILFAARDRSIVWEEIPSQYATAKNPSDVSSRPCHLRRPLELLDAWAR